MTIKCGFKKCEWLNLKKNFDTTAKNIQLYACENQHTNLSAEGLEPSQWITKMLAMTMAAENIPLGDGVNILIILWEGFFHK